MSIADYKVDVPEGVSGDWSVSRFVVTPEEESWTRMRVAVTGGRERSVPAGQYTKLVHRGSVIMSDTPAEIGDHLEFIYRSSGRVLIHGLGLGMVARACLRRPTVEHVTVVERSADVTKLVGPWLTALGGDRLTIREGDAFTWKPKVGERWNYAWHDIWPSISEGNLADMTRLHRRFGRRVDWQDSWARDMCRRFARSA